MKVLHVDSSINGAGSVSRKLSKAIADQFAGQADTRIDYLDLAVDGPGHLSQDALGFRLPPSSQELTDAQRRENAVSEAMVSQFLAADAVVIGAPLYNFSVPSQLKAWIDRLAQNGRTFTYTANGPKGLAGGKKVIVALSRGGIYSTTEAGQAMEHQESYLKTVFGFFGITDVQFIRAEGLDMGPESREKALKEAHNAIAAIQTPIAA
ncbi:MAG: FMN-dependent NADH-azoreductase [Candidimonas sp.]|jgi:FMN-dependent NADH-azoreductase